jgi:hypothetical protein
MAGNRKTTPLILEPGGSKSQSEELKIMSKEKQKKKTRGTKKVRTATKKQRRNKISKSGNPKGEGNKELTKEE